MIKSIVSLWEKYCTDNKLLGVFLLAVTVGFFALFAYANKTANDNTDSNSSAGLSKGALFRKNISPIIPMLFYGAVMALLLAIPFTALGFYKLQTVFFDYSYLWVMVPIIPVVAFFLVQFVIFLFDENNGINKSARVAALVLSALGLLLCGSLGTNTWKYDDMPTKVYQDEYDTSSPVFARLSELASVRISDVDSASVNNKKLTILASPNITEYIHFYCGNVATLYGRDMWEYDMRAFSYTDYPVEYTALYEWMNYCRDYDVIYVNGVDFPTSYGYRGSDEDTYDFLDSVSFVSMEPSTDSDESSARADIIDTISNTTTEDTTTNSSALVMYNNEQYIFGGLSYAQLAKDSGADIIVFQATEKTDTAALEHIKDAMSAQLEYIDSNSKEKTKGILGYYLLIF